MNIRVFILFASIFSLILAQTEDTEEPEFYPDWPIPAQYNEFIKGHLDGLLAAIPSLLEQHMVRVRMEYDAKVASYASWPPGMERNIAEKRAAGYLSGNLGTNARRKEALEYLRSNLEKCWSSIKLKEY